MALAPRGTGGTGDDAAEALRFVVAPAEPRHFRRERVIVQQDPAVCVHVASTIPPAGAGEGIARHWAILEGGRTIGLVQQYRGFTWAVERARRGDPRIGPAVADLIARAAFAPTEVCFGPEGEVRDVLDALRLRGLDLVELRRQEMMSCPEPVAPPESPPGFQLRAGTRRDLPWLLRAHAAMCLEDLGVDQVARNPDGYAHYFEGLARRRRVFVGELDGERVFKCEIAQESDASWLIEGVYTVPAVRGRRLATVAMAWICGLAAAKRRLPCLYVHRRNEAAIRVYQRVGFESVAPWATAIVARETRRPHAALEY
ncbi:MAG: GNAT family N-acetyltransferase [Candidatus Polarisedimenticolia bacterium]